MKLKELKNLQIGIVGEITTQDISLTIEGGMFKNYKNIDEAIQKAGEMELIQIYGLNDGITCVVYPPKIILDHQEYH